MITFFATGQTLKLSSTNVVADTLNYLSARFVFRTADWNGTIKVAHFTKGEETADVALTDDAIGADDGLNLTAGKWDVYLTGHLIIDGEQVHRITTNTVTITVLPSGVQDGEPLPSLPSVGEQILAQMAELRDEAGQSAASASGSAESAAGSADTAQTAAESASGSAGSAAESATAAGTSAANAAASASAASGSAASASRSAESAGQSASAAQAARQGAEASAYAAAQSAQGASGSAQTATQAAGAASASAQAAGQSESAAQTARQGAESAQTAAAGSASAAATSAGNAAGSATQAGQSATAAAGSASSAAQSATQAANSASAANTAKVDAQTAQSAAEGAQTAAETAQEAAEAAAERAEEAAESLVIDTELDGDSDNAIANAPVALALEHKAEIDGYYEDMTVGNAEQLTSSVYAEDQVPYLFRTSGGSADIGNRETDMIVGGTVAWNQQVIDGDFTSETYNWIAEVTGSVTKDNGIATVTASSNAISVYNPALSFNRTPEAFAKATLGHVYFYEIVAKFPVRSRIYYGANPNALDSDYLTANEWSTVQHIVKPSSLTSNGYIWAYLGVRDTSGLEPGASIQFRRVRVHDLTQMFGSTIADYLYNLEQSTPGAGVAWFKRYFPNDYYEYNPGELMSVEGLQSHDMVGFNALNPDTHVARVVGGMQYQITGAYSSVTFNDGTTITPDANGLFTHDKTGAVSVDGIGNDTCVHLTWSGYRNGEYEPYEKHSYPLDDSLTLRGIPKLDASGNLYYDGDTYESDGTVNRNIREIVITNATKFGTWDSETGKGAYWYSTLNNLRLPAIKGINECFISGFVLNANVNENTVFGNDSITLYKNGIIRWVDRSHMTEDRGTYESYLASNPIVGVYKVETPTTETADPYQNPQIVDDFGTEEYVTDSIVPVGHQTQYMANLRDKLQHLPDLASADGDYIVRQVNSQMSLAPLTEVRELPDAPTTDGSYRLVVTVAGGNITYSWEAMRDGENQN